MSQLEAALNSVEPLTHVINRNLLRGVGCRQMAKMLHHRCLTAFKIGKACGHLANLIFHAVQCRLKTFEMLKHQVFNIVRHCETHIKPKV